MCQHRHSFNQSPRYGETYVVKPWPNLKGEKGQKGNNKRQKK